MLGWSMIHSSSRTAIFSWNLDIEEYDSLEKKFFIVSSTRSCCVRRFITLSPKGRGFDALSVHTKEFTGVSERLLLYYCMVEKYGVFYEVWKVLLMRQKVHHLRNYDIEMVVYNQSFWFNIIPFCSISVNRTTNHVYIYITYKNIDIVGYVVARIFTIEILYVAIHT